MYKVQLSTNACNYKKLSDLNLVVFAGNVKVLRICKMTHLFGMLMTIRERYLLYQLKNKTRPLKLK